MSLNFVYKRHFYYFNHYWKIIRFFLLAFRNPKKNKYHIKLDSYYYHTNKKHYVAVLRLRNKRTAEHVPIKYIVTDIEYIKGLHPLDACALGILAHHEDNGLIENDHQELKKNHRFKEYFCFEKIEPLLEISKKYTSPNGTDIMVLRSKILEKEIEIPSIELCKKPTLLHGLNSLQAIEVGYEASECFIRNLTETSNDT